MIYLWGPPRPPGALVHTPTPPRAVYAALCPSGPEQARPVTAERGEGSTANPGQIPGTGVPTRDPGGPPGEGLGDPRDGWGKALPEGGADGKAVAPQERQAVQGLLGHPCSGPVAPAEDGTWEGKGLLGGTSCQDEWALLSDLQPKVSAPRGADTLPSKLRCCCPPLPFPDTRLPDDHCSGHAHSQGAVGVPWAQSPAGRMQPLCGFREAEGWRGSSQGGCLHSSAQGWRTRDPP